MTPMLAVLVPRRPDNGPRDKVWEFARPYWETIGPVFEGHHLDGPFNRSAAINTAARAAGDWDVAIIIDSDVIVPPNQVSAAVEFVERTGAPAIAFKIRTEINEQITAKILDFQDVEWGRLPEKVLRNSCSAANVIRRDLWDAIDGFDEGFVGWGWEDVAFMYATQTISGQRTVRIPGTLWHLWHPRTTEKVNHQDELQEANRKRHLLYQHANNRPEKMRALLAERNT